MRLQSRDAFSSYHPAVNFLYFGLVLFFTMCFLHPACLLLSLLLLGRVYLKTRAGGRPEG